MPSYCCNKKKKYCQCPPQINEHIAKKIVCLWQKAFNDVCVNQSLCDNGVLVLSHGLCLPPVVINGLPVLSPLANQSNYSCESSCGRWVNLYEIRLPDVPGEKGCKSSGELYNELLSSQGISIEADSYTWKGACPTTLHIHSKAIDMHPVEFTKRQICAIQTVLNKFLL